MEEEWSDLSQGGGRGRDWDTAVDELKGAVFQRGKQEDRWSGTGHHTGSGSGIEIKPKTTRFPPPYHVQLYGTSYLFVRIALTGLLKR